MKSGVDILQIENKKLYFFTSNQNKFHEARDILSQFNIHVEWEKGEYLEVQADDLETVARTALESVERQGVFLEDSGLFIPALKNFPGVYSSYVHKTIGNKGILRLMEGMEDRGAYFLSVIGLKESDNVYFFRGQVDGKISHEERGPPGFGYDPIFIPQGHDRTFAQDPEIKHKLSHRRRSLDGLIEFLTE